MKVLLDENVPIELRLEIVGHDCMTVVYRGWSGKKNGELLALAAAAGFDVLITKDTNLQYQQQSNFPVAIVVLEAPTNKIADIRPLLPAILRALQSLTPKRVTVVS